MNVRHLSKATREALGIEIVGAVARPRPAGPPLVGYFWLLLRMDPPTTTHHNLEIVYRGPKGKRHATLRKRAALKAAHEQLLLAVPEAPGHIPLAPPYSLEVSFYFGGDCHVQWHQKKPDLDNSVKLVKDVLAQRGWLVADEEVAHEDLRKTLGGKPAIWICCRTLGPWSTDKGLLFLDPDEPQGVIHPLPEQVAHELGIVHACNGPSRALEYGTPGGKRRPETPRPRVKGKRGDGSGLPSPEEAPSRGLQGSRRRGAQIDSRMR